MTLFLPLSVKDNAEGQLNAGISASATTIPAKAGEGSLFPQPITGQATSAGSQTVLNNTGIGGLGLTVGDAIYNKTDGSSAIIVSISTDSVTTSRLNGGSDNTWQSNDEWVVKAFVLTITKRTGGVSTGPVTQMEKVLITSRATDNLICDASDRGFGGTTPTTFDADDFISLFWTEHNANDTKNAVSRIFQEKPDTVDTVLLDTTQTISGDKTFSGSNTFDNFPTKSGSTTPTNDAHLATKKYVDDSAISGGQVSFEYGEDINALELVKIIDDGGTAKAIKPLAAVAQDIGTEALVRNQTSTSYTLEASNCLVSNSDGSKVVATFTDRDGSNNIYEYVVCGTVSGDTTTWGTPVLLADYPLTGNAIAEPQVVYDSTNDKFIVQYYDGDNTNHDAAVLSISGTTITVNTPVTYAARDTNKNPSYACAYSVNEGSILFSFEFSVIAAQVSGTSLTFGTKEDIDTTYYGENARKRTRAIAYDTVQQKFAVFYVDGDYDFKVSIATVTGTSVSVGSSVQIDAGSGVTDAMFSLSAFYNPIAQKIVCVSTEGTYGGPITEYYVSGVISGTSFTVGLFTTLSDVGTGNAGDISAVYSKKYDSIFIVWFDEGGSQLEVREFSQSGDTLTSGTSTVIASTTTNIGHAITGYHEDTGYMTSLWIETGSPYSIRSVTFQPFSRSADAASVVYGIAQTTGVEGESRLVAPVGSRSVGHSFAIADINSTLYIQSDFTISTSSTANKIGVIIDTDKVFVTKNP